MREALKTLQQERARRTVGTQARPSHGHALVQVGASKKVHSIGTSYDLIAPAAPAADADSPPVTHSAEIQTETAYMEREGGTGAPDPTTAPFTTMAVPSVSSGICSHTGQKCKRLTNFRRAQCSQPLAQLGGPWPDLAWEGL